MRDHVFMRAEDYDDIDESTIEVHEGHPVQMVLEVPVDDENFGALSDIAAREGKTIIDAAQDAIHAYVTAQPAQAASRRAAG
jgi:hypothetical protein